MGLSIYNIKKWVKMVSGRSILHVKQGVGQVYAANEVKGYYNDLTRKVLQDPEVEKVVLPQFVMENGKTIHFSIQIFQYGLGAYDLYLMEGKELYEQKFRQCLDWALENMNNEGGWDTFGEFHAHAPYSSMAQGEGASLLVRGYVQYGDDRYLKAAKRAIEFMLKPVENGGTAVYANEEIFLKEYTHLPTVLNGWIFSLFGLYDYLLVTEHDTIQTAYETSVESIKSHLEDFDRGYWSQYDMATMMASPFYHSVHIAQLDVLETLTGMTVFGDYRDKWEGYSNKRLNRARAFVKKAVQKLAER